MGRDGKTMPKLSLHRVLLLLLIAIHVCLVGCVRRRLLVRTNPAGASVYVDKQLVGSTPTATAYTYYGTREIEVVADGYRTERVLRTFSPPWYQIPPLDFISETLWPWELRDERIVDITLTPEQRLASEVLQARADNLRLQAAQGIATPIGSNPQSPFQPGLDAVGPNAPQATVPTLPLQSGFDAPPPRTDAPVWIPGQALQNFVRPGGQPPLSVPEAGILPGGGYRPEM